MTRDVDNALRDLRIANPLLDRPRPPVRARVHPLQKVLVANRGEIAKRFFFVLKEEGIPSVAVVTDPDRKQSWYEFADEVVYIGDARNYTNSPVLLAAVELSQANAVYPGYGFLSESLPFVEQIGELSRARGQEIVFLGPPAEVMRRVGSKLDARALAQANGIPLVKGTDLLRDLAQATAEAGRIGYPIMVKLSAGGGGKGMTIVAHERELATALDSARRLGRTLYGDDAVYLEQYVQRPVHVEVQIFNGMAVGIRKCAVQRRNQKIIEETGDFFLEDRSILRLLAAAENMAAISGYADGGGAGTVEFLFDAATEQFGFLEINTRLQVEYPVTDQSLSIDLAKWQVLYFDGREREIPYDQALRLRFAPKYHAIECRIYAEDPWKDHAPSPGVIQELDLPTFNGIRCDFGFRKGDTVLPHYDPMIGKLIARGSTRQECLLRLERALGELYIRGITTNIDQLLKIVRHPEFRTGAYTNRLLIDADELGSEQTDAEQAVDAAAFCALCELRRSVHNTLEEILSSGDLENLLRDGSLARPSAFRVEVHEMRLRIDLVQVGLETYHVFANHVYYGQMQISQRVDGIDDFLILFRGRSYPARIDRRPSFHTLRVMEGDGRMHYYRLRLQAVGPGQKADSPGTVRSPFQCSFVRLAADRNGERIRVGSPVGAGDPLIAIEAMKMESVLRAPVSGSVTYLVEDGDLARLVRGTTSEGLIVGKPLTEGEILVIVEAEGAAGPMEPDIDVVEIAGERNEVLDRLRDADLPDGGLGAAARVNPASALPSILELMRAFYLGYVQDPATPGQLQRVLDDLRDAEVGLEGCDAAIAEVVDVYAALKQIYSPILMASQTWFGELNRWVLEWDNETYTPPDFFRAAVTALLGRYGISWTGGRRTPEMRLALVYILRAYSAIRDGRAVMASLLTLLEARSAALPRTLAAVERLVGQEQSERDDSLARLGRGWLARAVDAQGAGAAAQDLDEALTIVSKLEHAAPLDPFVALSGDDGTFRARARAALKSPEPTTELPALPAWVRRELEELARRWSGRYRMDLLPSCIPTVLVYRLTPLNGVNPRYACIAWLEDGAPVPEREASGRAVAAHNVEAAFVGAGRLLAAYDFLERGEGNIVAVLACEGSVVVDLAASDPTIRQYDALIRILGGVARLLDQTRAEWLLVQSDAPRPGEESTTRRVLSVSVRHGQPRLDLLQDTDRRNPLWNGVVDDKNQRLFDRRKWPVELWVQASFDPDTAREIVVASIDGPAAQPPGARRRPAVAAKIYDGLIGGRPAVFFLKDSRVSGGATGDLEGRKYAAACYYAYLKDRPLYIWNDGAGANIRQGMVALNRAAEGFMMNALLAHGVSYERFLSTVRSSEDPALRALWQELDGQFGLADPSGRGWGPRTFFMVAVGVGSSTGLDVYGSSQASIQVLLDAEESYRVLTGSNVIRAVTGEALTNYEIGGARVMGPWTGTVDLVARDRVDLLRRIRQIHELFSESRHRPSIARRSGALSEAVDASPDTVLNERRITANVDAGTFLPFKGEYAEAGALVGGFARLGDKHVLIMGPRTDSGLRSFASVVRAKELLQTANETRSPKILVVGRTWYFGVEGGDDTAIRARMDFFRLLCVPSSPRVDIVTHPEGLALATFHSHADAVIYVPRAGDTEEHRRLALKTASFQAASFAAAVDLANQLFGLFAAAERAAVFVAPSRRPSVPLEASRPYDMVTDVIEPLVDEGSFLEFYRDAAGGAGSTLITGLATLHGRLAAVIADQTLSGGAPDAPGTEKFRVFMELLDRQGIPLVMLSNAPGFVPGTKQERLRIQQIGGESLDVNVLSRVPVVSVVLNQNFGGRQIHAFSRFLRPGIAYIALDRASLAVMGGPAAFDLFHGPRYEELRAQGKKEEADRLRNEFLAEFTRKSRADQDAMRTGVLDWAVPDVGELRAHVIRAMALAEARAAAAFGGLPGRV